MADPNDRPDRRRLADTARQIEGERRRLPRQAPLLLTVQQQLEAISAGDFEKALEQADPNITLEIYAPPEFRFIVRAKGVANVRNAVEYNFNSVEDQQPVLTNVIIQDEVVVLMGNERGRIRATGSEYHVEFVHRFVFTGKALTSIRIVAAHATATNT